MGCIYPNYDVSAARWGGSRAAAITEGIIATWRGARRWRGSLPPTPLQDSIPRSSAVDPRSESPRSRRF